MFGNKKKQGIDAQRVLRKLQGLDSRGGTQSTHEIGETRRHRKRHAAKNTLAGARGASDDPGTFIKFYISTPFRFISKLLSAILGSTSPQDPQAN